MSSTHEEMIGEGNETEIKDDDKKENALADKNKEFNHLIDLLRNADDPCLSMDLLENLDQAESAAACISLPGTAGQVGEGKRFEANTEGNAQDSTRLRGIQFYNLGELKLISRLEAISASTTSR